jgi:hypothetical protein
MADDKDGLGGRDLQQSQSGGDSGVFGGNMAQQQRAGQAGGGPGPGDAGIGGSSGTGGYGSSQEVDRQDRQAGQPGLAGEAGDGGGGADGQSRGERFDEEQGGGRGPERVSADDEEIAEDQRAHQDRGQSEAEFEREDS